MTPITPKELSNREFSKSIRGYNVADVDAYINRVTENYALLYRENIELAKRVKELELKLVTVNPEDEVVRQMLEAGKRAKDALIEEGYARADDILVSIKTSCDSILRNFRDKIAAQKQALADIQEQILTFKNELYEKYRLHIELIEQISPIYEYEEDLTPAEYVEHIVDDLKKEVAAQYDISLESLKAPGELQSKEAMAAVSMEPTVEMKTEPKKKEEPKQVQYQPMPMPQTEKPKKKKANTIPSVMELLDEYEIPELVHESSKKQPKAHQFMLDIDGDPENGELLLSKK